MTFFDDEMEKLDKWADDRRHTLKITLNEMEEEIKELKKQARTAGNMPEKLKLRKKAKELEKKKDEEWKSYENESRKIEEEKDQLIESIEKSLKQKIKEEELFAISWIINGEISWGQQQS